MFLECKTSISFMLMYTTSNLVGSDVACLIKLFNKVGAKSCCTGLNDRRFFDSACCNIA